MTDLNAEATDAQWLAHAAAQALEAGRYALGVELGRLAQRAAATEANGAAAAAQTAMFGPAATRDVPLIGSTRMEYPARLDSTQIMQSHAPAVCSQLLETNGSRRICGEPIQWFTGRIGDENETPVQAGWYHSDARMDNGHRADPATY